MNRKIIKVLIFLLIFINIHVNYIALACEPNEKSENDKSNFIICIDPGHQGKGDNRGEPVAPGSNNKKARVSSGTAGVATKRAEHVVNLEAAMILKEILVNNGYKVVMTRESADVNISNVDRAEIANKANADITIRIHCDSINDGGKVGASILVPSKESKYTSTIYEESNKYATILCNNLKESNVKVNGIFERSDITGFNWSKVPVIILEMGFMSNYNEDRMLSNPEYQRMLMECVVKSIDEYRVTEKYN